MYYMIASVFFIMFAYRSKRIVDVFASPQEDAIFLHAYSYVQALFMLLVIIFNVRQVITSHASISFGQMLSDGVFILTAITFVFEGVIKTKLTPSTLYLGFQTYELDGYRGYYLEPLTKKRIMVQIIHESNEMFTRKFPVNTACLEQVERLFKSKGIKRLN